MSTVDRSQRRAVVTGATGSVGSQSCRRLVDHGAFVAALVRDDDPQSDLLCSGTIREIAGTWNLFEACRVHARLIKRVAVATSDQTYGERDLPSAEDMPLEGRHPCVVSKSCTGLLTTYNAEMPGWWPQTVISPSPTLTLGMVGFTARAVCALALPPRAVVVVETSATTDATPATALRVASG